MLDIKEGGNVDVDHILEQFKFTNLNIKLFNSLVGDIFPEMVKTINVLHLIDGLLRGLDINYKNDKW